MTISRDRLRFFSPFDTLSSDYLDKLLEKAQLREVPKGKIIFKRGKALTEHLYLTEGQVDLVDSQFERTSVADGSDASRYPLNNSEPTKVSAISKTEVTLLEVERDYVDLVMAWSQSANQANVAKPAADEQDWMSYLLEAPLFSRVPPGNIQQLFVRFDNQEVDAGTRIVREGEPGDFFYVLERGHARVTDKAGKKLAELGPGDFFGEEALVGDTTRNANVDMATDGSLMRLEKDDFRALLQEPMMHWITADELEKRRNASTPLTVIDVRLPIERRMGSVPDSRGIPLGKLRKVIPELDSAQSYVVTDDAGRRSNVAAQLLLQAGLDVVILEHAETLYPGNQAQAKTG